MCVCVCVFFCTQRGPINITIVFFDRCFSYEKPQTIIKSCDLVNNL